MDGSLENKYVDELMMSDNGNKWPHASIEPGCLVKSRAGVGAGGLSPNSSLAGSFIFFVASTACSAAPRPGADGAVLGLRLQLLCYHVDFSLHASILS